MKILFVFGTRPEAIKIAPIIKELRKYPNKFDCRVCISAQHRQMLDPFLKLFGINPDYDLNIMRKGQNLEYITVALLRQLGKIIKKSKADYLLVQGDTTTAMAASLAAYYQKVKVIHIEAGLRTGDKMRPYPEEVNRKIIDSVSDLYFAHTKKAKNNLLREGISEKNIEITGNTVIDALLDISGKKFDPKGTPLEKIPSNKKIILVTAHRRESFGKPLINICKAIKQIALKRPDLHFVYPVHLNPNVQKTVYPILKKIKNVLLTKPLGYLAFAHLIKKSYLILTDSGGIQEEAPSLNKPLLVLREVTERPEGVKAGTAKVVGTDPKKIFDATINILRSKAKYQQMSKAKNPYGDGKASRKIASRLMKELE